MTVTGVKKAAAALRKMRETGAEGAGEAVEASTAVEDDDAGPGTAEGVREAVARRHCFNRHILQCEVAGVAGLANVRVRDSGFYRVGERFEVRVNDGGQWEAVAQRAQPRFR